MGENDRRAFEAAALAFQAGRWDEARAALQRLAADGAARFLTEFMADHPAGPPKSWDGVIEMTEK